MKLSRTSAFCRPAIASRGGFSHSIIRALIQFILILASVPHGPLGARSVPSHCVDTHTRVHTYSLSNCALINRHLAFPGQMEPFGFSRSLLAIYFKLITEYISLIAIFYKTFTFCRLLNILLQARNIKCDFVNILDSINRHSPLTINRGKEGALKSDVRRGKRNVSLVGKFSKMQYNLTEYRHVSRLRVAHIFTERMNSERAFYGERYFIRSSLQNVLRNTVALGKVN